LKLPSLALAGLEGAATVLCVGAHCDDIEIGCGGALVRLAREHPELRFQCAIFTGGAERVAESRNALAALVGASRIDTTFFGFRESYLPSQYDAVKDAFESLKHGPMPSMILTHRLEDRHQDHRLLGELTWNTFRSHLVLEYEIAKYEGDLGQPNLFVPLGLPDLEQKIETLLRCFPSQAGRTWFSADTFRAVARLRGIECASPSGFAEAFHARKLSI
jgi:LmbE family N-acetylglucosaminyl deacetylase